METCVQIITARDMEETKSYGLDFRTNVQIWQGLDRAKIWIRQQGGTAKSGIPLMACGMHSRAKVATAKQKPPAGLEAGALQRLFTRKLGDSIHNEPRGRTGRKVDG